MSRQAIAQAVTALQRHHYISRLPDPADARAQLIELTSRGRQVLQVMPSAAIDLERRWQQTLGRRRLDDLRESLQMLLAADSA